MKENSIDSQASVSRKAELLGGVRVGPFAVIEESVVIGAHSDIASGAIIKKGSVLGERNTIAEHAVIGAWPQDIHFDASIQSGVRIGNDNVIREHVSIHRASREKEATIMGNNCFCMVNAHLAHDCSLADRVILANNVLLAGFVRVDEGVFISGSVAVHQHVHIGRYSFISALVALAQDAPPFAMVFGSRRGCFFGINSVGLRRAGFHAQKRLNIKEFYNRFYSSADKGDFLKGNFEGLEEREIADFIQKSKRGVIKKLHSSDTRQDEPESSN